LQEKRFKEDLASAVEAAPTEVAADAAAFAIPSVVTRCNLDLNQCPLGWHKRGALCFAQEPTSYHGPCTTNGLNIVNLSGEAKFALAAFCELDFPCLAAK